VARIEVEALSSDTHLELKALQGQPAMLELLTQQSRTQLRPWHGHVMAVTLLGSDGGFARYRNVIEPWLGMLAHRPRQLGLPGHDRDGDPGRGLCRLPGAGPADAGVAVRPGRPVGRCRCCSIELRMRSATVSPIVGSVF
jgi:hypothetical protein